MSTRKRGRFLYATVAVIYWITLMLPLYRYDTYAANVPQLEQIRVSLFIDSRGTVPAVTLSSGNPLAIGVRNAEGTADWIASPEGKPVRFSLNAYSLRVLDTTDYAAAVSAYEQIAAVGQAEFFAVPEAGKLIYQVRLGGFRSAEEALAAKSLVPSSLMSAMNGPDTSGPYYASAGSFPSRAEAANRQSALAQQGIISFVSIHPNNEGAIVYSVWIGESSSEDALEQAKSDAAAKSPGLSLQSVKPDLPYMLVRTEASAHASGASDTVHYRINSRDQNVWVSAGEGEIKVSERFGRIYRGNIEITSYGGKLAVINQLPFEQYLYSVVSSELGASWPPEALKAQAVAARTYALKQGMKYKIAHISDTTFDQSYKGKSAEFVQAVEAVDATRGEVLVDKDGLIVPYYSSNTGGLTADVTEAWSSPVAYVKSVPSPDEDAQKDKLIWYRIMLPDGTSAYIRSDYAAITSETNDAGLPIVEVQSDVVNIRRAPYVDNVDNAAIRQASTGERFVWIGQEIESNPYHWIRGPFTGEQLLGSINAKAANPINGKLQTLEISARGPSERVTGMKANGADIVVPNADSFRSAMNGLPSTRFEIEQTGQYTVLGASGRTRTFPAEAGPLAAISNRKSEALALQEFYVMGGSGNVRAVTAEPQFRFVGLGFGHGVGLSQYGAKSFAELGYDYQKILKYYYDGVSIVKE